SWRMRGTCWSCGVLGDPGCFGVPLCYFGVLCPQGLIQGTLPFGLVRWELACERYPLELWSFGIPRVFWGSLTLFGAPTGLIWGALPFGLAQQNLLFRNWDTPCVLLFPDPVWGSHRADLGYPGCFGVP
uniref:Uncharacterized protein n=1 Tax=Catharus ustulatus TaxID=91951 RepID=A0A8C3UPK4_CATUS